MNIVTKKDVLIKKIVDIDYDKIYEIICLTYIFLICFSQTGVFGLNKIFDSIMNIVIGIAVFRACYLIIKNRFSGDILVGFFCWLIYAKILVLITSSVPIMAKYYYIPFVIAVCVLGVEYKKVLRPVSLAYMFVILYGFITSFTNIIDTPAREYTRTYGDTIYHIIRSGWGLGHENTLGLYCFVAIASFCLAFDKLSKILRSLVAFGVAAFVWIIPNSRFNTYLLILLGVALIIDHVYDVFLSKKVVFYTVRRIAEIIALILTGIIPILMICIVINYERLSPALLQKLDAISSGRISLGYIGYKDMGFSLWGQYLSSSAYLDSSWMRLPVLLGIPMTLFVIAMLLYTGIKALAKDDFLLAFLMLLVSTSCICYETLSLGNYNILLILPFASCVSEKIKPQHIDATDMRTISVKKIKQYVCINAGLISVFVIMALVTILRKPIISILQTWIECAGYGDVQRTVLLLLYILTFIMMVVGLMGCIRGFVCGKQYPVTKLKAVCFFIASCLIFVSVQLYGYCYINSIDDHSAEYEEIIADKEAMSILKIVQDVDVVSQVKPYLYKMYYDFPNLKWMPTADYARFDNITVIVDARDNYRTFSHTGFVQTPISDYHKIYTNDSRVIEAMEAAGYSFTSYSQYVKELDLDQYADLNELNQAKDGSIIVKSSEDGIAITEKMEEDFVNIYNEENCTVDEDGRYILHMVIQADVDDLKDLDNETVVAHVLLKSLTEKFLDFRITASEFDNGVAVCDIPFFLEGDRWNTIFTIDEACTIDFSIKEMSYYRTE